MRLADFGMSKKLVGNERAYTVCGTAQYMSPEVFNHNGCRFEADFWALGILIYELCSGGTPFGADKDSRQELYRRLVRHRNDTMTFPTWFDIETASIVRALLHQDETASRPRRRRLRRLDPSLVRPRLARGRFIRHSSPRASTSSTQHRLRSQTPRVHRPRRHSGSAARRRRRPPSTRAHADVRPSARDPAPYFLCAPRVMRTCIFENCFILSFFSGGAPSGAEGQPSRPREKGDNASNSRAPHIVAR